jgi:uncharacterized membrane protein HdeD (DUF308 family)
MAEARVVATYASAEDETQGDPLWWILLVTGSLWSIFALVIFRFDYTTVTALSILLGTVCMCAALFEVVASAAAGGWWRVTHIVLAAAFAVIGILAYVHPENSFKVLATIFAFFLLIRGVFEIVASLLVRPADLWWVGLVSGVVQVLLAFWAAGDFGNKAFLLVIWVGASALVHGVVQIVTAFRLRPGHAQPG